MIRVAQVATAAGSIQILLLDHIERLRAEGYDVEAVCAPGAAVAALEARGMVVRTVPLAREPAPRLDARSLAALRQLFATRAYDVVHSHTPKAGLLAPLAARLAGTRVILHTIHGLLFHDRSPLLARVLGFGCELWTARLAHRLLSQTREDIEVARRYRLCRPDRIEYIGNGIDVRRFSRAAVPGARAAVRAALGFADGDVVVGVVGRLVDEKGFREFARALEILLPAHPRLRGLLVAPHDAGQSDALDPDRLLAAVDRSRVVHLGHRDDMPEIYAAMDVFALPSYREGLPRTVMEAAAMGLPVVASDIRGCREVVRDGKTGLLVAPRDAAALAAALGSLIDDPERRRSMGEAGSRHVRAEFDAAAVRDRLVDYYRRIVGPP